MFLYFKNGKLFLVSKILLESDLDFVEVPGDFNFKKIVDSGEVDLSYSEILNNIDYVVSRRLEYDKLNQNELRFNDDINGTTTWIDSINAIKKKYPKLKK